MSSHSLRFLLPCAFALISATAAAEDASQIENRCKSKYPGAQPEHQCAREACKAEMKCGADRAAADQKANALGVRNAAATRGHLNQNLNAGVSRETYASVAGELAGAKNSCQAQLSQCQPSSCTPEALGKNPAKKSVQECQQSVNKNISDLTQAEQAMRGYASDSNNTGKETKGSEQNPQQAQQPQQQQPQQQSPQQQQPQSPQSQSPQSQSPQSQTPQSPSSSTSDSPSASSQAKSSDPCQGANANLYAQCKGMVPDRCKNQTPGAVGFAQPDPACAGTAARGGGATNPTCARFQQQCAGNTTTCLQSMSATDRAKIQSECLSQSGSASPERQGVAGFGTQSVSGGRSGGGGGGGSFGSSGAATLDPDVSQIRQLAETMGQRDAFGDMRVDASGGYAGGGGGGASPGESSWSVGGATPVSAVRRSTAASGGEPPGAANASDVDNRYGRSVFNIQSMVLQERCNRGRLLHCVPQPK